MFQHDTAVAHLDSSGAAELKSDRELAPRRPCDLHRKTADISAARGGLVMDQRITELRDRFIGINGVPPKRRSTSARRVGAYYDARSSEWFG